jgi:hypothetical protein
MPQTEQECCILATAKKFRRALKRFMLAYLLCPAFYCRVAAGFGGGEEKFTTF